MSSTSLSVTSCYTRLLNSGISLLAFQSPLPLTSPSTTPLTAKSIGMEVCFVGYAGSTASYLCGIINSLGLAVQPGHKDLSLNPLPSNTDWVYTVVWMWISGSWENARVAKVSTRSDHCLRKLPLFWTADWKLIMSWWAKSGADEPKNLSKLFRMSAKRRPGLVSGSSV